MDPVRAAWGEWKEWVWKKKKLHKREKRTGLAENISSLWVPRNQDTELQYWFFCSLPFFFNTNSAPLSYYKKRSGVVCDISPSFMKLLEMEPGKKKNDGFWKHTHWVLFLLNDYPTIPQLVDALRRRCLSFIQSGVHTFIHLWESIQRLSVQYLESLIKATAMPIGCLSDYSTAPSPEFCH